MKHATLALCATLLLASAAPTARAQVLSLHTSSLLTPCHATSPAGDNTRLFVVERIGRIRIVSPADGHIFAGNFLDIRPNLDTRGDGGLLGMAFDPNYAANGIFYIYHNETNTQAGIIARYHRSAADPNAADPASRQIVYRYPRPIGHNAGWIGFGPDGYLYLASGDGGTAADPDPVNAGQTIVNQPLAKILRFDVSGPDDFPANPDKNYRIPPTNPFVGVTGDDEIFAYGVRNPWRCSFDRETGDLWFADVGQEQREEVNIIPAGTSGQNFGWRCMEGSLCTNYAGCSCPWNGVTPPLWEYDHTLGCSITGGYVYRGNAIPTLRGAYICGDWCTSRIWALRQTAGVLDSVAEVTSAWQPGAGEHIQGIASSAEDAAGEVYLIDYAGGKLWKILPTCAADFNGDGFLDFFDPDAFIACFEGEACPPGKSADFNGDGFADFFDADAFVEAFELGC